MTDDLREPVGMPSRPLPAAILRHKNHDSLAIPHSAVCEYLARPYSIRLAEKYLRLKVLNGMPKRLYDPEIVIDQASLRIKL